MKKNKLIILLVVLSAIFLFSMQLCSLIFGNKPVVAITSPINNATISGTTLTVSGTISDLDGDQSKVKVWIEDTSVVGWDYGVTSGIFEVTLALSGMTDRTYYLIAEGYDSNNNVSDKYTINIVYSSSGGGGENAPYITVINPTSGSTITSSTLQVIGTVTDLDKDAAEVYASIDGQNISGSYDCTIGVESLDFSIDLDLSSLSIGPYTLTVYAVDADNHQSNYAQISFTYATGTNYIVNGTFTETGFIDNDITYNSPDTVVSFLNKVTGDYLPNWTFTIGSPAEDGPKIDIQTSYVRMYTTIANANGSGMSMTSSTISNLYTGSNKTIRIKFKIYSFGGGDCTSPFFEAPIKIWIYGRETETEYLIAAFTTNNGSASGGWLKTNVQTGLAITETFTLPTTALDGTTIPDGLTIESVRIECNGWTWDVVILSIEIY